MRPFELERGVPAPLDRLLDLTDAPDRVFLEGELVDRSPRVAIVGARRASELGCRIARRLARDLAGAGALIVSGGAIGIDAAAHAGALEAGGSTLIVLPTSVADPQPRQNRPLFDAVLAAGGAWISEVEGPNVARCAFVRRNRLIAALAEVVVVVEAALRSGTQATVSAAQRLGRPVAAVPWSVTDAGGAGCLDVLRRGGRAVVDAGDVWAILGSAPPPPPAGVKRGGGSLEDLLAEPMTAEGLAEETGRDLVDLLRDLGRLEVEGRLRALSGGRFVRV